MGQRSLPVEDVDLNRVHGFRDLMRAYERSGGFMAKRLGKAYAILKDMFDDEECTVFISFTADIVATGARGVIRELVQRKLVDVLITTCGSLDHDLARSWGHYRDGSFSADDRELDRRGIHRLGNVYIEKTDYGELLEERMQAMLQEVYDEGARLVSPGRLWRHIGASLKNSDSILHWAAKNEIPVIVPGPLDGAVGSQLWFFSELHRDFRLDLFEDQRVLSDMVHEATRTGALIVGGGISKHHLLWWNQFRGGLDYAVQITTAVPWDGSLSGASLSEAISWGKISPQARMADVWGEATTLLPVLIKAVLEET